MDWRDEAQVFKRPFPSPAQAVEKFRNSMIAKDMTAAMSSAAAGPTTLTGEFLIKNSGEKRVPIDFPIAFSEKPLITFGAEVQEGDVIVDGFFPTVSVIVSRWITVENPPFSRIYRGCELAVVVTGAPTQKVIVQWQLTGVAFGNPI
jgi:hypothetical protein